MDYLIKAFCPILLNSANIFQAPTMYIQHYANWILAPRICFTSICPRPQGRLNGPVNGLSVNFILWPHVIFSVNSIFTSKWNIITAPVFLSGVIRNNLYDTEINNNHSPQMWLYLSLAVSCNFSCFSKGFMPLAFTIPTSIFPQFPVWS